MKPKWKWLPPWNMPSDPVRAVLWFLHWSLQVLVRYFYVLILVGVAYETYLNGAVGLFGILLVGLLVWGGLAVLLLVSNFAMGFSKVYSEFSQLRQKTSTFSPGFSDFDSFTAPKEENVVEGSIITDLDEERRKRRQEM
jgi:hypothetical protein